MGIQGKTVVFTGKISHPRHVFQKMVEDHGGIAGSDVTKNTDYLVVGEKPGSKLFRATMYGVKTISEGEFLGLLKDEDDGETPLSFAELECLNALMETRICSNCGKDYKQWTKLPNYETCPVCEILIQVRCPHCEDPPTFAKDFGIYHCFTCGSWFKAPHSIHAKHAKHLHLFTEKKREAEGAYKQCLCGYTIFSTNETLRKGKENYELAPQRVKEWNTRDAKIQAERKKRIAAFEIMENLTPEQILYLERQLVQPRRHNESNSN